MMMMIIIISLFLRVLCSSKIHVCLLVDVAGAVVVLVKCENEDLKTTAHGCLVLLEFTLALSSICRRVVYVCVFIFFLQISSD